MASLAARILGLYLRKRVKPRLAKAPSPQEAARALDARPPFFPAPLGVATRRGGVEGLLLPAKGAAPRARLLYLHGGAYFAGAPSLYGPVLNFFARAGFEVFAPAYRLAPLHPFPAALDDARAAFDALCAQEGAPFVLAGDSAGGGLALALMAAQRDAGRPLPKAAALFSPWTDLAATGASARENEARDALFTRLMLRVGARAYLAGQNAKTPLASPLYAALHGLPPLVVHASEDELLRDDATRLVERGREAGVAAALRLWPGVPHGWQLAAPLMREARESLDAAAAFLLERV
ncbi:alpha/beta hydrolase [Methylocystis sp. 9N]|uniref:Alpha/beta hydrolase n=1 Tax=Methylocystis borbori TaxID=3118750 RepID=A0ABU7XGY8_9HYPH